jgi:acetylglutamate kinase
MRVIKIGGNELDHPEFVNKLANGLKSILEPKIIVHGGGKAVDLLQKRLGIETKKIEGLRYSDGDTIEAALMTLCGSVNARLVASLLHAGIDALGLSGIDGGLLKVHKLNHPLFDLGWVGEIEAVRTSLLHTLLDDGLVPVIAPISIGTMGQIYNVNADHAASAIAAKMNVSMLDFVSNVPGVLVNGKVIPRLDQKETEVLIENGSIHGGMLPKVHSALDALHQGVEQARIVDLKGLQTEGGTVFSLTESSSQTPKPLPEGLT